MSKGIFIAFEGSDGAGKTTALRQAAKMLEEKEIPCVITREPGGCEVSEKIRGILLDPAHSIDPRTEALLYAASRREHLVRTILPALNEGKVVLCDRFLDSSKAYQGKGRCLGMDAIEDLNDFGLLGFRPDVTLFYAVDPETGRKRIEARGAMDRLDAESRLFFERVNAGFEELRHTHPEDYIVIDGTQSMEEVADQTRKILSQILQKAGYEEK